MSTQLTKAQALDKFTMLSSAIGVMKEFEAERTAETAAAAPMKIGDYCVAKLAEIAYYEDASKPASEANRCEPDAPHARAVGFTYDEILADIAVRFPMAKTKVASLRWYAAKMNRHAPGYEGHVMPRRPRSGG